MTLERRLNTPGTSLVASLAVTTRPIERIAVINRGEPAMRFLRALREYNFEQNRSIKAIAFVTTPDAHAPFVRMADEVVKLGEPFIESDAGVTSAYCHHDTVMAALADANCDAVWPGWGFVSEDATFVAKLEEAGIVFLGPSSAAMQQLGDKIASKQMAEVSGVPLAPWRDISSIDAPEELLSRAEDVGYPLMVKASAGGGGRGIRKVDRAEDLVNAVATVREEVQKAFGQGGVFFESCITNARHIEVQFVVGADGQAISLGVRDCSIQRRNQKVIEEAPSPVISDGLSALLCEATARLAAKAGYCGVGTAEYLVQLTPPTGNGHGEQALAFGDVPERAFFLEVNSRLQVEHTITELLTGIDLVKAQIDIAQGLPWRENDGAPVGFGGHAIEVRLNAENPERDFCPSPGKLLVFRAPFGPGIRVDNGVIEGMDIAPQFDSMIAKVIAWAPTRKQAIARLTRALQELAVVIEDGTTNKAFLLKLLAHDEFLTGRANTSWLDGAVGRGELRDQARAFEALVMAAVLEYRRCWRAEHQRFFSQVQNGIPQGLQPPEGRQVHLRLRNQGWHLSVYALGEDRYRVGTEDALHDVSVEFLTQHSAVLETATHNHQVLFAYGRTGMAIEIDGAAHAIELASSGRIKAPAPAMVVHIAVEEGDDVAAGELLCTLEAMKMEMPVYSREAGIVRSILCRPNQQVHAGQALILLEPRQASSDEAEESASAEMPIPTPPPRLLDRLFEQHLLQLERFSADEQPHGKEFLSELSFALNSIFLGFDVSEDSSQRIDLLFGQGVEPFVTRNASNWGAMAARVSETLDAFADVEALFEKGLQLRSSNVAEVSPELHFYEFCRRYQEGEEGASEAFRPLLMRALRWYDVHSLAPSDAIREALWRMAVAHTHGELRHRLCSALMRLLMALHHGGVSFADVPKLRDTLARVAHLADVQYPFVADNARQAAYVLFEQSRYVQRRQVVRYHFEKALSLLAEASEERRSSLVKELTHSRHSLLPLMVRECQLSQSEAPWLAEAILLRLYPERSFHVERLGQESDCLKLCLRPEHQADASPARAGVRSLPQEEADISSSQFALPSFARHPGVLGLFVTKDGLSEALDYIIQPGATNGSAGCDSGCPIDCVEVVICGAVEDDAMGQQICEEVELLDGTDAHLTRLTVTWCNGSEKTHHRTFLRDGVGLRETELLRDIHPEAAARIELWQLQAFHLQRLETPEQIYAFQATAVENPKDERIFVFAEVGELPEQPSRDAEVGHLWEFEQAFFEGLRVIREAQAQRHSKRRFHWNSFTLYSHPVLDVGVEDVAQLARRFESHVRGLGLHRVVLRAFVRDDAASGGCVDTEFVISKAGRHRLEVRQQEPSHAPLRAMRMYDMNVVKARQRGMTYPYEIVRMLEGQPTAAMSMMESSLPQEESGLVGEKMRSQPLHPAIGEGHFVEYELSEDESSLVPVHRPHGQNACGVVVGVISHITAKHPEGMRRVWIASDPTRAMGSLSHPECLRILAALKLAENEQLPIEWIPISAGARIAMDSGTENLDWTARVLRRIIEFTRAGGVIHLIIDGVNVGAQSYWNAEATMLMHTKGALIMTPSASMVLTGKKALEVSGSVSAEDERGIGGFERIMGPNGQAQYAAVDLAHAYHILFDHYLFTYQAPGEVGPRALDSQDPVERSILNVPYQGSEEGAHFQTVGEIFDEHRNPGRKKPFAIREVMRAVIDQDGGQLERYQAMRHAETAVVWDAHMGGMPVCMIGFESHPQVRSGRIPMDGPDTWTGGTLYPQSSKKVAWAINAASGNRPVVVLANLSGFDGSPESLRKLQLEMGAEIGRAVVSFDGPLVFVVIGRYHGGAYVVFSKALNPQLTTLALEGTFASVIGGAPAAAVVFPHTAKRRTEKDERMRAARAELDASPADGKPHLREKLGPLHASILLEKQGEIAKEFDAIHTVERAVSVGSIDAIIPPARLRPAIIECLQKPRKPLDS